MLERTPAWQANSAVMTSEIAAYTRTCRRLPKWSGSPANRRRTSVVAAANSELAVICHANRHAGVNGLMAATCASEATINTCHHRARGVSNKAVSSTAFAGQTTLICEF